MYVELDDHFIAIVNYTSVSRIGSAGFKITKINNKYLIITFETNNRNSKRINQ